MEFMGFKECMNFLIGYGIIITSFISDHNVRVASHMKKSKNQPLIYSVIFMPKCL